MPTPAAVLKRRLCAFEARAAELRERIAVLQEEVTQVDAEIVRWRIGSEIWVRSLGFVSVVVRVGRAGPGGRCFGAGQRVFVGEVIAVMRREI
ncbi:hypothetical protein E6R18_33550, partial [Streptomyces sp. A1277]